MPETLDVRFCSIALIALIDLIARQRAQLVRGQFNGVAVRSGQRRVFPSVGQGLELVATGQAFVLNDALQGRQPMVVVIGAIVSRTLGTRTLYA